MKKFKTKKIKIKTDIKILLISVLLFIILGFFNNKISVKTKDLTESKLDEISTLIVKKDITPINYDLNKLIELNYQKNEISYIDINTNYAYQILYDIVRKIQNNLLLLESGNFINDNIIKSKNGNVYILINLGIYNDGVLFSRFGPNIPIKIDFYENVLGTFDVDVTEYGINNSIIKCYLTITLTRKIMLPLKQNKTNFDYKMLLGSKIITGTIPSIYGTNINKSSSFEVGV